MFQNVFKLLSWHGLYIHIYISATVGRFGFSILSIIFLGDTTKTIYFILPKLSFTLAANFIKGKIY